MRRALLLSSLLAALAGAAGGTVGGCGGGGRRPASDRFGANAQFLLVQPPDRWGAQLDAMAGAGVGIVRSDAYWDVLEPAAPAGGSHAYRWQQADAIVSALARRGLRWLPTLGFSARWAASLPGQVLSAPRDPAAYAVYAAAVARRYGPAGDFWPAHPRLRREPVTEVEVWNEPNQATFWMPRPDPAAYARMLLAASRAVRAAAPGVRVMVGGLSGDAAGFLRAMHRATPGLRGSYDAVAQHLYAPTSELAIGEVAKLRRALIDLGEASVPIDITEAGWPTRGNDGFIVPDAARGAFLADLAARVARGDCGITRLVAYAWVTRERDPADAQDWFGLYDRAAHANASGRAYAAAARRLASARPVAASCP